MLRRSWLLALLTCIPVSFVGLPAHALDWQPDPQVTGVVTCAAEGPDGAVRVGDADGRVWRLGAPAPLVERAGHVATALHIDPDGTLWVGWEDGVLRRTAADPPEERLWDKAVTKDVPVLGQYMRGADDTPFGEVECLGRTARGLLAGSTTNGLLYLVGDYMWDARWPHFWGPNTQWLTCTDLFPSKRVHAVLEDGNGDLWLASADGILLIDRASMLFARRRSGYYSGTYGDEAYGRPGVRFTKASHGLPSDDALCVACQPGVGTWFGFAGGGVALRDTEGAWHVTPAGQQGLPWGSVTALATAGDGSVWAAVERPPLTVSFVPVPPQPLRGTVPGSRMPHFTLTCRRGDAWQNEPFGAPRRGEWPAIHALLCSRAGKLFACTSEGLWSASVAAPTPIPPRTPVPRPGPIADAAQPADLPPASAAANAAPADPQALLQAVVERNRAWLLPPSEAVTSLEYRFTLEDQGLQQRFRWQAPSDSTMDVTWDRDGLAPDLLSRKWVSFDEGVSEAAGDGVPLPLSAERLTPEIYRQDCLSGGELQTALRIYARRPEAFSLRMLEPGEVGGQPALAVELKPDRGLVSQIPEVVPRLFMVAWSYGIAPSHLWRAVVRIDRDRLVPLLESWYWEDDPDPTHQVRYGDARETPGGGAVPLEIAVRFLGRRGRDEPQDVFHARYAWYEPGVWLPTAIAQTGDRGEAAATVSDVRVNAELGLADELRPGRDDLMDRRARAIEVLSEVAERNSPWLGPTLDPAFLEASYRFELRGADGRLADIQTVDLSAENAPRWAPQTLGNTLGLPLAVVLADPARYEATLAAEREQDGRRVYLLRAGAREWVPTAPCGNGLSGRWNGYFTWAWRQLECVIDAETLLPVSVDVGEEEQQFRDYQEVAPGRFAPMTIIVPGWFEYRFTWAEGCLWIARETLSHPDEPGDQTVGRLTNLRVNGRPVAGVPDLSADEIAAAEAQWQQILEEEEREHATHK